MPLPATPRDPATAVFMMGAFAPPVHGMAVAFGALADAFAERTTVIRARTSPDGLERNAAYHVQRARRWLWSVLRLALCRRKARIAVMSVDAGFGMIYLIGAVAIARALGYRIYLQHHSYAYINQRFGLMTVLARLSSQVTHLCSCDGMTADLGRMYPSLSDIQTLPMSYAIATKPSIREPANRSERLRLGLFGNLTVAKGLLIAVETLDAAIAMGLDVELVMAGPLVGEDERRAVDTAIAEHEGRVTHVGAVYGTARDEYLSGIDLFLFPSRYKHESFGLAFWEALGFGASAVGYRAGCLTPESVQNRATVLDLDQPFVDSAVEAARALCADRTLAEAGRSASKVFVEATISEARERLETIINQALANATKRPSDR